jgi:uncharacterized protein YndB with AHSA1/START domain
VGQQVQPVRQRIIKNEKKEKMSTTSKTQVIKDFKERSVLVSREFNAPLATVWRAYTDSEILDQWWGPAPWRAETKTMNFKAGGFWLYAMVSPEGQKHWGRMNYISVDHHKGYQIEDAFCDENGNAIEGLPVSKGHFLFTPSANGTLVDYKMVYNSAEDLQKIVEMGFEQGIIQCSDQLDQMLAQNKI